MVEVPPNAISSVMQSMAKFGADVQGTLKYAQVAIRLVTESDENLFSNQEQEQDENEKYMVNSNGFQTMPNYKAEEANPQERPNQGPVIPVKPSTFV